VAPDARLCLHEFSKHLVMLAHTKQHSWITLCVYSFRPFCCV